MIKNCYCEITDTDDAPLGLLCSHKSGHIFFIEDAQCLIHSCDNHLIYFLSNYQEYSEVSLCWLEDRIRDGLS
jgi:hypothetical protein